jgi:hypothetical protein
MRPPTNRGASWIGGLALLLLGGLFLLQNLGGFAFMGNWWTIFIFIPAEGLGPGGKDSSYGDGLVHAQAALDSLGGGGGDRNADTTP